MKLASLVLASVASTVALVSAQPEASNLTASSTLVLSNVTHVGSARYLQCSMPENGRLKWYYNTRSDGPYDCYGSTYDSWGMLNTYRKGGSEGVHWKYTEDKKDNQCLYDWAYYAEDGTTLITKVYRRTVLGTDRRLWCALPIYRSGGVEGYQWGYCTCKDV